MPPRKPTKKPPQKRTNKFNPDVDPSTIPKEEWDNPRPGDPTETLRDTPRCQEPRSTRAGQKPGLCANPAGLGTDHPGEGPCKLHGGNSPSVLKRLAQKNALQNSRTHAIQILGLPIHIGPHEALLMEVQRTAGHIEWLGQKISQIGEESEIEALQQWTVMGIKPSFWLEQYQAERHHLVLVSKAAIQCGVAERAVALAEEQGKLLAMAIRAILWDAALELTPLQQSKAPAVIRKHLLSLPTANSTGHPLQAEVIDQGDERWQPSEVS